MVKRTWSIGRVIGPDLGGDHLMFGAQAARRVERVGRHVEIKRHAQTAERPPFGHRFERVDRFAGLDFDRALQPAAAFQAVEHDIGVHRELADVTDAFCSAPGLIDHVELPLVTRLQKTNDAVVLELLADRAHEYRAHLTSGIKTNSII